MEYIIIGVSKMATKSFLKNVKFNDKPSARSFLVALENAEGRKGKTVRTNASIKNIKDKETIIKIFEN